MTQLVWSESIGKRVRVGGSADRIVPPGAVDALWRHWGQCSVYWYAGAHLSWSGMGGVKTMLVSDGSLPQSASAIRRTNRGE